jgi:Carboxypeptidase regulatory-like domain
VSLNGMARRRLTGLLIHPVAALLAFVSLLANPILGAHEHDIRGGQTQGDARVSGHVYRADSGAPIAGAVVILSPCYVAGVMWTLTATTAPDGSYTVSGRPFCYFASATSVGFVPQAFRPLPDPPWGTPLNLKPGDKVENADFHLGVAAVISGSVFDEKSQPVANLNVLARRRRFEVGGKRSPHSVREVTTDDQGKFRFYDLAPGDYLVCADAARRTKGATGPATGLTYHLSCFPSAPSVDEAQPVHATLGKETSGIRFQITAGKTYNIVAEPQDPAPDAIRRSYDVSIPGAKWTSDRHGNVTTFEQMFPGTYTVVMFARDSERDTVGFGSRTIQVTDSDVHISIPIGKAGEVRGHVTMSSFPEGSLSGVEMVLDSRVMLDAEGKFAAKVSPGPAGFRLLGHPKNEKMYLKQVRCSGQDYSTEPLMIEAGQVVSDCEVTLAADAAVVSGSVFKGDKPAAGMAVVVIPQSIGLRKIRRYTLATTTDNGGHFQIEPVIPGDYYLFAVPIDMDASYYALDFADRHQNEAQSISVKPNETRVLRPILTTTSQ